MTVVVSISGGTTGTKLSLPTCTCTYLQAALIYADGFPD